MKVCDTCFVQEGLKHTKVCKHQGIVGEEHEDQEEHEPEHTERPRRRRRKIASKKK